MLSLVELRFAVNDLEPDVGFEGLGNDKLFLYLADKDKSWRDREKIVEAVLEAIDRSDVYEIRRATR